MVFASVVTPSPSPSLPCPLDLDLGFGLDLDLYLDLDSLLSSKWAPKAEPRLDGWNRLPWRQQPVGPWEHMYLVHLNELEHPLTLSGDDMHTGGSPLRAAVQQTSRLTVVTAYDSPCG